MIVHDVAEYITRNIPPASFYIQDLLPKQGIMLLFGSPKVGKSWLSLYMGMCIAVGNEFLGFRVEQAKTMIVQFEISPTAYYWRMRNMSSRFALTRDWLYELSPSLQYIDQPEPFNRVSALIRPFHPKVIILDCLSSCFSGDENDSADMARLIGNITSLKDEHEASIILVHHARKAQNQTAYSFSDMARGQSRLAGWVDTLVYLAHQPSGLQLQVMARQASREIPNINIRFNEYIWERR